MWTYHNNDSSLRVTVITTILHGDSQKLLKQMSSQSVDVVITDPPFGMNFRSNRGEKKGDLILGDGMPDEAFQILRWVSKEILRLLKDDGHFYCFCHESKQAEFQIILRCAGFTVLDRLCWAKGRGMGDTQGKRFVPAYELILWAVKTASLKSEMRNQKLETKSQSDPNPTFPHKVEKGYRRLNGHPSNLIWVGKTTRADLHPAQKDIFGLTKMLEWSSNAGDVVLDPFAGSGSLGIANLIGLDEGQQRRVILMEKDSKNVKLMVERLSMYGKINYELPMTNYESKN